MVQTYTLGNKCDKSLKQIVYFPELMLIIFPLVYWKGLIIVIISNINTSNIIIFISTQTNSTQVKDKNEKCSWLWSTNTK